jgi:hypothetical protein
MAAPKKYDIEFFKQLYVTGQYTLRGICKEFGPSYSHISNISARDGWGDARRVHQREALKANELAKSDKKQEELADLQTSKLSTAREHQSNALRSGDRLGELIQTGVLAVKSSNWRELKNVVETWKTWDDQMRKNHNIEDNKDKPLVNINVLAALPSLKEKKAIIETSSIIGTEIQ